MRWTDEEHAECVRLRELEFTYKEIADKLESKFNRAFSFDSVRNRIRRTEEPTDEQEEEAPNYKETFEIKSDGSQISDKLVKLSEVEMKDEKYILLAHGYDPSKWEVVNAKVSRWHYRDKESKGAKISYAIKLTVKPKKDNQLTVEDIKYSIHELMRGYKPIIVEPTRYEINGRLLEVNVSDLHINKLGYKDGEYDHLQAERIFFHILTDVIDRTKGQKFEKILFIWSHDFFNIDNLTKTTTAGTPQDTSTRYSDMYKQGKRMLIQGINLLKEVAPVETIQVGANHDRLTSYTLSEVLESYYRLDDNVTIDTDPISRKYRKFGKCLLGFSHGNMEKKRLGKIIPVEAREYWGETEFCEMHAAHLHSEQAVVEENGVIIRYLSSPSGTDLWHFDSGYVGAIKKTQCFIWDKELGVTDVIHSTMTKKILNTMDV